MSTYEIEGQSFVSSRDIDKERRDVRDARQRVLDTAERKHNAKREKEEEAWARGDHKWMLPGLDEDIDARKKKKKHKKEKKHKKDKKKRDKSDSEDDWVESEKNVKSDDKTQERDSFLEFGLMNTYSKTDLSRDKVTKKDIKRMEEEENNKVAASRELNPALRAQAGLSQAADTSKPRHGGGAGDGGLTWLLKAFKRAEDQASEGGISIEDIAEKRWGSLETYLDMVSKARDKADYIDRKVHNDLDRIETQYGMMGSKSSNGPVRDDNKSRNREVKRSRSRSRDRRRSRSRSKERRKKRSRSRSFERRKERRRSRSRSRDRRRERSRSRSNERPAMKFVRPGEKISSSSYSSSASRNDGAGSWKSSSRRDQEREEMKRRMDKKEEELKRRNSSSESESDKEEPMEGEEREKAEEPVKLLTESELNSLAAKIVKAEIMGNDDLAAEIKAKLDAAKVLRAEAVAKGLNPDNPEPETVVKLRGGDVRQKRKKTKVETHSKGGDRVRYFGDDDKYDLKQLFEREKLNTAEDQMGMLNKYASKAEKTNDDFDVDDMMISKVAGKRSEEQEDVKRRNRAAAEQMAMEKTLHDCKWCIGSKRSQKHLMVAMGKSVYLSLPGTVCIKSLWLLSCLHFLCF